MKTCLEVCTIKKSYTDLSIGDWVQVKNLNYEQLAIPYLCTLKNSNVILLYYIQSLSTEQDFINRLDYHIIPVDKKRTNTNIHSIFGWNQSFYTVDEINEQLNVNKHIIEEYNLSLVEDCKKLVMAHERIGYSNKKTDEAILKQSIETIKQKAIVQCFSLYRAPIEVISIMGRVIDFDRKSQYIEKLTSEQIKHSKWKTFWALCKYEEFYIYIPCVYLTTIL
jgi:hypothetical protein